MEPFEQLHDYLEALDRVQSYEAIIRDAMKEAPEASSDASCNDVNDYLVSEKDDTQPCFGVYADGMAVFYVVNNAHDGAFTRRFIIPNHGSIQYSSGQIGPSGISLYKKAASLEEIANDREIRGELSRVAGWFRAMQGTGWRLQPSDLETVCR